MIFGGFVQNLQFIYGEMLFLEFCSNMKICLKTLLLCACCFAGGFGVIAREPMQYQPQYQVDSAMQRFDEPVVDTAKIVRMLRMAYDSTTSNPLLAQQLAQRALQLSQQLMFVTGIAGAHNTLGIVNLDQGRFQLAINRFATALTIYTQARNNQGIIHCHNNLALAYSDMGDFSKAIEHYTRALMVLDETDDKLLLSNVLINSNLAKLYIDLQIYHEAETFLKRSLELIERYDLDTPREYIYSMQSQVALSRGDHTAARHLLQMSNQWCQRSHNSQLLMSNLCRLADILLASNNMPAAEKLYGQSLQKSRQMGNIVQEIRALNALAYLHYRCNRFDTSSSYADSALALSHRINFPEGLKNALLYKGYVEYAKGLYKQAYEHNVQSDKILRDSSNLAAFTIAHLLNKIQHERERYQNKLVLHKKKVNTLILAFIIVTLTLASTIVFQYFKHRIKRIKANEQALNQQLALKTLHLAHNNEAVDLVVKQLRDKQQQIMPDNQNLIQGIIVELENSKNSKIWDEFEYHFTSINPNFYFNLNRLFPHLSNNENRLCALLSLNLNTKEIAQITKSSTHAVYIARGRLRKKLGLTNSNISLYNFLSSFK